MNKITIISISYLIFSFVLSSSLLLKGVGKETQKKVLKLQAELKSLDAQHSSMNNKSTSQRKKRRKLQKRMRQLEASIRKLQPVKLPRSAELITKTKSQSEPSFSVSYLPRNLLKLGNQKSLKGYSAGYIKEADLINSFFKNEKAVFNRKKIQRNDIGGELEFFWYKDLYNKSVEVFKSPKSFSSSASQFYQKFCNNFLESSLFKSLNFDRYYSGSCYTFRGQLTFSGNDSGYGPFKNKVHLQPHPKYQIWTLLKLMDFLANNREVQGKVANFKTNFHYLRQQAQKGTHYYDRNGGPFPSIVIYVDASNLNEFFDLLSSIRGLFRPFGAQIEGKTVPRYNYKFDKLIHFSLGNGDYKREQINLLKNIQRKLSQKKSLDFKWNMGNFQGLANDSRLVSRSELWGFVRSIKLGEEGLNDNEAFFKAPERSERDIKDYIRLLSTYVPLDYYRSDLYNNNNFHLERTDINFAYDLAINKTKELEGQARVLARPVRKLETELLGQVRADITAEVASYSALSKGKLESQVRLEFDRIIQAIKSYAQKKQKEIKAGRRVTPDFISEEGYTLVYLKSLYGLWFTYKKLKNLVNDGEVSLVLKTKLKKLKTQVKVAALEKEVPIWLQRLYIKGRLEVKYGAEKKQETEKEQINIRSDWLSK